MPDARPLPYTVLVLAVLGWGPAAAQAQASGEEASPEQVDAAPAANVEVDAFLLFGFGGALDVLPDDDGDRSTEIDLDPVIGFGGRAHVPVWRLDPSLVVGVGGLGRLAFVRGETGGRQTALDLDASAQLGYQAEGFVAYGTLAVGLSLSFVDDDLLLDVDTGLGWNLSPMVGIAFLLTPDWAAFVELGLIHRNVNHETTVPTAMVGSDFNFRQTQFTVQVGARYQVR